MAEHNIPQRFRALEGHVAELRRKSQGITRANRRAEQVSGEVEALRSRIDRLGDTAGPAQSSAFTAELERLDRKVDGLWADLEVELSQLRTRVDEHDLRLASHGERIECVEVEASANASAIASIRASMTSIHPAAYIVALVVGVIASLVWNARDWAQTVQLNGVDTVVQNSAASSPWTAIVCGVAVGLVVLFVLSFFLVESNTEQTSSSAAATANAQAAVRPAAPPTQVMPVVVSAASSDASQGVVA